VLACHFHPPYLLFFHFFLFWRYIEVAESKVVPIDFLVRLEYLLSVDIIAGDNVQQVRLCVESEIDRLVYPLGSAAYMSEASLKNSMA
jgi:hypothetical protein